MKHWWNYIDTEKRKYCLSVSFFQYKFHVEWREIEPAVYSENPAKTKNTGYNATFVKANCVCRLQRNWKYFGQLITSCYRFKNRKG